MITFLGLITILLHASLSVVMRNKCFRFNIFVLTLFLAINDCLIAIIKPHSSQVQQSPHPRLLHPNLRDSHHPDGSRKRVLASGGPSNDYGGRRIRLQPSSYGHLNWPVPGKSEGVGALDLQLGHLWGVWYRFPRWEVYTGTECLGTGKSIFILHVVLSFYQTSEISSLVAWRVHGETWHVDTNR